MNAGGNELGASVYSEAKSEYTKQLSQFILTPFHRFFMDLLTKASEEEQNSRKVLSHFQDLLSQIPEWNIDKVERETSKIITETRCDYLEELVTAVFIAHTKILTAIRLSNKNKKVQITVPKLNHFVHRSLIECGRQLWGSVFLFQSDLPSIEKQKKHREIEALLREGISIAISGLLPIKSILKDNIPDNGEDDDEEDEKAEVEEKKAEVEEEAEEESKAEEKVDVEEKKVEEKVEEKTEEKVEEKVEPKVEEKVEPKVDVEEKKVEEKVEAKVEVKPENKVVKNQVEVIKEGVVQEPFAVQTQPTIILEDTPQVKFADMVHTYNSKDMGFAPSTVFEESDNNIQILDDDAGEISDIEDLNSPEEALGDNDFETL